MVKQIVLASLLISTILASAQEKEIIVEPGTFSLEKALHQARALKISGEATVVTLRLQPGTYNLNKTIILRPEDSHTHFEGADSVFISGGVQISGWKQRRRSTIWEAPLPYFCGQQISFQQMWINGIKAKKASTITDSLKLNTIKSFDPSKETIYIKSADVPKLENISALQMTLVDSTASSTLRINSFLQKGDSIAITFCQPDSYTFFSSPQSASLNSNTQFFLSGSKDLIVSPGEWAIDLSSASVLYKPRDGEDLTKANVIVPALQSLIKIEGTDDAPVEDITIEDITFCNATWQKPLHEGFVSFASGLYISESMYLPLNQNDSTSQIVVWADVPSAAIEVSRTNNFEISDCSIERCASSGINIGSHTSNWAVKNCNIVDCGGSAIVAGSFGTSHASSSYDPLDRRIVPTHGYIGFNKINNVAQENWSAASITIGYTRNLSIDANEIDNTSSSAISLGWGPDNSPNVAKNNCITKNKVTNYATHIPNSKAIKVIGYQINSVIKDNTF